jgi:hypothetical protein
MITSSVILCLCGAGGAYFDLQWKRGRLYEEQSTLNSLQATFAKTRSELESRQRSVDEIQEKGRRRQSLEEQKRVLKGEIATMEHHKEAAQSDLANAVREIRAKAAGTTRAELRLADGQVLNSVRFVSVSNVEISVAHDGGMVRLPAKSLPRDLQDRFRFGTVPSNSLAPVPPPVAAEASAPPAAVAAVPGPAPVNNADQAQRLQTLNTTVVALRARLLAMENQARYDSIKEQRLSARSERLYPSDTSLYQTTKTAQQLEREAKRKFAEDNLKAAAVAAKNKEMDALRNKISEIEGEIQRIANGHP